MIEFVVIFLVLALLSALFGFTGLEWISLEMARILFGLFIILFIISLIWYLFTGKRPSA